MDEATTTWLHESQLDEFIPVFQSERIDLKAARDLTDDHLKGLGLPLGDRLRLLKAVRGLADRPVSANQFPVGPVSTAERRQLTVLFCDLVGSTALSGSMDPEALRGLMGRYHEACRGVVEKYAGYVAQYLGDGVMAYFGWPVAHEDDAERALRAGLELVGAVKAVAGAPALLQVRIGVATGPVVVGEGGGDSSPGSGAGTPKLAVGETPNLAARLQGLSGPDEIMASAPTRRLAGGNFEVLDLGSHVLKGIVEPVQAWKVLGLQQTEGRFEASRGGEQRLSAFVGREQEVGLLAAKWSQASGGEGQVVLLEGEPGIGKSRITQWLLEHIGAGKHYRLRYQSSPYHAQSAFHPVIEQIERGARFGAEDGPESRLDKLEGLLNAPTPQSPRTLALFAALLGLVGGEARYGALNMTPQKQKELTLQALTGHVTGLSREAPVLLLLEDAHWIDPSTLESLSLTVEAIRSERVLVLITYRPEFKAQWTGQSHVSHVILNRLSPKQTRALAEHVAGGHALPEEIVTQIVQKTDGIPLFVEELTKAVLEAGLLELAPDPATDGYKLKGPLSAIAIPATLRDSLTARLDRLSPTKEVAQIGACIGREFGYGLLEKVAGLPEGQLKEALDRLTESELAFQRGEPPEATYTFKHALIQDAAYDGLLNSRKILIHARIAETLVERFPEVLTGNPEVVASHLTKAGDTTAAAPYWIAACELATKRFALLEAIDHASNAMTTIQQQPPSQARATLELRARLSGGVANMAMKGWAHPDVRELYAPAVPLAKDLSREHELTPLFWALSMNDLVGARIPDARNWVSEALEVASRLGSEEMKLIGHMAGQVIEFFAGNLRVASRHGDEVIAAASNGNWNHIVHEYNHDPYTLWGIYAPQWTWLLGYPDKAVEIARKNEIIARQIGHPFNCGFVMGFGSSVYHFLRDPKALQERSIECERIGIEHGLPFMANYQKKIPLGFARVGSPDQNVATLRDILDGAESIGSHIMNLNWRLLIAEQLALGGFINEAADLATESLRLAAGPRLWDRVYRPEMYRIQGFVMRLKGALTDAEALLRESVADAQIMEAKSWELRASTDLARLMKETGRSREAEALLRPIYDWFTEGRDTRDHIEARQLLDELEGRRATH